MAAFQFPDPAVETTVVNPITGSTYQWQDPPGKWVVTVSLREVGDIIWEGETPPDPIGDYKLWYSTDTLELYFYYCDANNTCAWVPTSAPITMLEDLDTSLAEVRADVVAVNIAINQNENRIDSIIFFGPAEPLILPDDVYTDPNGNVTTEPNKLNYKFWCNTDTDQLFLLRKDEDAAEGYSYELVSGDSDLYYGDSAPTDDKFEFWYHTDDLELLIKIGGMWFPCTPNNRVNAVPTLQEVLSAGPPVASKDLYLTNAKDDVIDLSVTEGRVVIGTMGADFAPKFELRHKEGAHDAVAIFELDEGGTRLDIEADGRCDNIHFRFNNDHKFILNKTGDAEFIGRVKASPAISDNEIVTYAQLKTYIEPEFYRYMWDPTITDFSSYTDGNQDASAGQLCSMTGPVEGSTWHYMADKDLDGNTLRAPMVTPSAHGSFDLEVYVESAGVYLQPPYVDVYPDGKEFKKRFTVNQCQRSKAVAPPPVFSVYYPWLEINGMAVNWSNEFWADKRELFIKVK